MIAQKLTNLKETMRLRESTRAKSNPKHTFTMNEQVNDALDRLAANAPHLYDVGDPYQPDGMRNNAPHYKAARGTNLTESINTMFSNIMRGGSYSLLLAVGILMSAMTMYNADRRRAAGYELDYVHYNRRLIEDINKISARVGGVATTTASMLATGCAQCCQIAALGSSRTWTSRHTSRTRGCTSGSARGCAKSSMAAASRATMMMSRAPS